MPSGTRFDEISTTNACKSNAVIQPILIYWANRPIIYFGEIIESKGVDSEDILKKYISIQQESLSICGEYVKRLDTNECSNIK